MSSGGWLQRLQATSAHLSFSTHPNPGWPRSWGLARPDGTISTGADLSTQPSCSRGNAGGAYQSATLSPNAL